MPTPKPPKTPEEREYGDAIEQPPDDELQESEEETILRTQLGHIPGRLPEDWNQETRVPGSKEVSLDHATDDEWKEFLESLNSPDEDE